MRHDTGHKRLALAALGLTASCLLASTTWAKFIENFTNPTHFDVQWTQMPDFDQVRHGIPNDGLAYCAPTSAMNMMAYIARHGYPNVLPGSHNYYSWHTQENYDLITSDLGVMGFLMGTDPVGGTGGDGDSNAIAHNWLNDEFLTYHEWAVKDEGPRVSDLAAHMLVGRLVQMVVGWYNTYYYPDIFRDGGHLVTLDKVVRDGDGYTISIRDPANEQSDLDTQSLFVSHEYATSPELVYRLGKLPDFYHMYMDKIVGYGTAYLDGYLAVGPAIGFTQNVDHYQVRFVYPESFTDVPHNTYEPGPSFNGEYIIKSVQHSAGVAQFVLTADGNIWEYDPLHPDPTEVAQINDPKDLVFSRFNDLYTLGGRTLNRYTFGLERTFSMTGDVVVPDTTDALAADDRSDSLLLLDPSAQQILRYSNDLDLVEEIDVNAPLPGGNGSIAVSPVDGTIFVTSAGSPVVYELVKDGNGNYTPLAFGRDILSTPTSLNVTNSGEVIVSSDELPTRVFEKVNGVWQLDTGHPFYGLTTYGALSVPHSRSNYDPSVHNTAAYRNVLPTQFSAPISDPPPPASITATAEPANLWPPNGKTVSVTVSGNISDPSAAAGTLGATYSVRDEYGTVQPSGDVPLGANGDFSFSVPLQASRSGSDKDGRDYVITISAQDGSGDAGVGTTLVVVPHDQHGGR